MIELTIWQYYGVAFCGAVVGATVWHWIRSAKIRRDMERHWWLLDKIREGLESETDGE